MSSESPEFDEGDSQKDSREEAVLANIYQQIKTRKLKGKAL